MLGSAIELAVFVDGGVIEAFLGGQSAFLSFKELPHPRNLICSCFHAKSYDLSYARLPLNSCVYTCSVFTQNAILGYRSTVELDVQCFLKTRSKSRAQLEPHLLEKRQLERARRLCPPAPSPRKPFAPPFPPPVPPLMVFGLCSGHAAPGRVWAVARSVSGGAAG